MLLNVGEMKVLSMIDGQRPNETKLSDRRRERVSLRLKLF